MSDALIPALVVAALGVLTYVADRHPSGYRRLSWGLIYGSILIYAICKGFELSYHLGFITGRHATEDLDMSFPATEMIVSAAAIAYLFFLQYLPSILGLKNGEEHHPKDKVDKKGADKVVPANAGIAARVYADAISPAWLHSPFGDVSQHRPYCQTGMESNLKAARGFTLTELLVVIAIIAILAALVLPVLSSAKAKARQTTCSSNLRQINLGVRMYSDDSRDASPSPGGAGLTSTNIEPLYSGYKALMKNYVGLNGTSSPQDKLFQCPADAFFPNSFYTNSTWPHHFVLKSIHDEPLFDYSSYAFNGGDNTPRNFGRMTPAYPGLTDVKLSSVRHPARTVLVAEISALVPYSWHAPSSHGVAHQDGTMYTDSKNVVSFVDGHVSYIKMYWNPGHGPAVWYNPPDGYDYQWSPD